jgi:PAS domain S-box-containing protein
MLKEGGYRFDFVSARWCEILGLTEEDVYRDAAVAFSRVHPDDLKEFVRMNEVARNSSQPFVWEGRWIGMSGEIWLHIESSSTPLPNGDSLWNGFVYDVTDRKQDENTLRFHSEIMKYLAEGVFLIQFDSNKIVFANPRFEKMFGYDPGEMLGKDVAILNAPGEKSPEELKNSILGILAETGEWYGEIENIKKDGTHFWCYVNVSIFDHPEYGKVIVSVHNDITERRRAEDELRESHENLRAAQRLSSIGSWKWIVATDTVLWSEELYRINGYDPKIPAPSFGELSSFYTPESWKKLNDAVSKALESGESYEFELDFVRTDGILRSTIARGEADYNTSGKIVSLHGTVQDITDRKRAEEEKNALEQQLHQAQKMESLGVLAGGIAHDFNNILAVIICNCSLGIQRPKMAAELLPEIESAAQRAAGLCRQMLAYAGKTQFVESHLNMTALVDDMLHMLKSTLPQHVTIKPYLSGDMPDIKGDASQLRQVVMNLIINASEALGEEQGEIRVALTKTDITSGQQERDHLGKVITPGSYLCLEVTDTGCGMDDETKQRIFEPFYTTKFPGRGLGMSAVLGGVTSHKGALQLTSQPWEGTTVKIYLPVRNGDATAEPTQQTDKAPWRGSGTILLVEDEPQLIAVAKDLLETLGFKVIKASNGIDAIEQYRKNASEIGLVLTDVGMPLMDGYELIAELKKLDPKLPIIISSGFGDTVVTSKIAPEEIVGLISKPYSFEQLQDVLKGLLEKKLLKQEKWG